MCRCSLARLLFGVGSAGTLSALFPYLIVCPCRHGRVCSVLSRTGVFINALSRWDLGFFTSFLKTLISYHIRHRMSIFFSKLFQKLFARVALFPTAAHLSNIRSILTLPAPDRASINIHTHCLYIK